MSKNIEELIHNIGLYKEIELEADDYRFLQTIIDGEYKTEFYCCECHADRVFTSMYNPVRYKHKYIRVSLPAVYSDNYTNEELDVDGEDIVVDFEKRKLISYKDNFFGIIQFNLACSMNPQHIISFIVRIKENKISKIGQYPSLADLEGKTIGFEKELGSYYIELNKAIGLNSHGIGIGSFVYLRRIIEYLVEETRQEALTNENWNDEEFSKAHFDEKIKLLENYLPEFLVKNRTYLYSIVSKGIHELNEDECKRIFPLLKRSIEMILVKRIAMKEQKRQEKELSDLLGKEYESQMD